MTDVAIALYLDLLKRSTTNLIYQDPAVAYVGEEAADGVLNPFSLERRIAGGDWPSQAHTMIGLRRLDNIQFLVEAILRDGTAGDLIETGVGRGGSTIFMRGVLKAYQVSDRAVWAADSFQMSGPTTAQGASERCYTSPNLIAVHDELLAGTALPGDAQARIDRLRTRTSLAEVQEHFARYDLLDDQVKFLPGWFCDTLPAAPIDRLALLRLDGDFYDSTLDALRALYPKLSVGGYVIVDDYGVFLECRQAVHDYLDTIGQTPEITAIDEEAVFWQKVG